MASWVASGCSDDQWNGTYVEAGTYQGHPYYRLSDGHVLWRWATSGWILSPMVGSALHAFNGASDTLPANPWINGPLGAGLTPPTFVEDTGGTDDTETAPKPCRITTPGGLDRIIFPVDVTAEANAYKVYECESGAWSYFAAADADSVCPLTGGVLLAQPGGASFWLLEAEKQTGTNTVDLYGTRYTIDWTARAITRAAERALLQSVSGWTVGGVECENAISNLATDDSGNAWFVNYQALPSVHYLPEYRMYTLWRWALSGSSMVGVHVWEPADGDWVEPHGAQIGTVTPDGQLSLIRETLVFSGVAETFYLLFGADGLHYPHELSYISGVGTFAWTGEAVQMATASRYAFGRNPTSGLVHGTPWTDTSEAVRWSPGAGDAWAAADGGLSPENNGGCHWYLRRATGGDPDSPVLIAAGYNATSAVLACSTPLVWILLSQCWASDLQANSIEGTVNVSWVYHDSDGRAQNSYRVTLSQLGAIVHDTGWAYGSSAFAQITGVAAGTYDVALMVNNGTQDAGPYATTVVVAGGGETREFASIVIELLSPAQGAELSGITDGIFRVTADRACSFAIWFAAMDAAGSEVWRYFNGHWYARAGSDTQHGHQWDTRAVPNGSYTVQVGIWGTVLDPDGEELILDAASVRGVVHAVTVDNTGTEWGPSPTVQFTAPENGVVVSGIVDVSIQAQSEDGLASIVLKLGTEEIASWTVSGGDAYVSHPLDTAGLIDGTHLLTAIAADINGQEGQATVAFIISGAGPDTTAPSVVIWSPAAGSTVSGIVEVRARVTDNRGVYRATMTVDGDTRWGAMVDWGEGPPVPGSIEFSFMLDTAYYAPGPYVVTVSGYDFAGNEGSDGVELVFDGSPGPGSEPSVEFTAPAGGASVSGTAAVRIRASSGDGLASIVLMIGDDEIASWTVSGTLETVSHSLDTTELPEGACTLTAIATDVNELEGTATLEIVVANDGPVPTADTEAPVVEITSPATGSIVTGTISVVATITDNVGVERATLFVDGAPYQTLTGASGSTYTWALDTTRFAPGAFTISVTAWDAAGNEGSDSIEVQFANSLVDTEKVFYSKQVPISQGDWRGLAALRNMLALNIHGEDISEDTLQQVSLWAYYHVPGDTYDLGEYTPVVEGRSHQMPADATSWRYALRRVPRMGLVYWETGSAEIRRLGVLANGNVAGLCIGPNKIVELRSTGITTLADLAPLVAEPRDMVIGDGKVFVAYGPRIAAYDQDSGDRPFTLALDADGLAIASVNALAYSAGALLIACTMADATGALLQFTYPAYQTLATWTAGLTQLVATAGAIYCADAAGKLLKRSGSTFTLELDSGESGFSRMVASGETIFAGATGSGKLFARVAAWSELADFEFSSMLAGALHDDWMWFGGTTAAIWRQMLDGSFSTPLTLDAVTAVNDMLVIGDAAPRMLYLATSGADARLYRLQIAPAGGVPCTRKLPPFQAKVLR